MQWLRLYDDVLDDPKVQKLSPALFRHWINLLCLANKGTPRGRIPNDRKAIAYRLRLGTREANRVIDSLISSRLLHADSQFLTPNGWDDRQKRSDNSAPRVAKHRASNVTEPLLKRDSNALDTDTDTDTEKPPKPPRGGDGEFEGFWKQYPRVLNNSKAKALKVWARLEAEERVQALSGLEKYLACDGWRNGFAPHTTTYLNGKLWEVDPPPARASPSNGHKPEERRPRVPRFESMELYKTGGGR